MDLQSTVRDGRNMSSRTSVHLIATRKQKWEGAGRLPMPPRAHSPIAYFNLLTTPLPGFNTSSGVIGTTRPWTSGPLGASPDRNYHSEKWYGLRTAPSKKNKTNRLARKKQISLANWVQSQNAHKGEKKEPNMQIIPSSKSTLLYMHP